MASKKRRLKWVWRTGVIALALVLAFLLLLPVWWPWALSWGMKKAGVEVEEIHRLGYTRFALAGVRWDQDAKGEGTRATVDRLEAWLPTYWLWLCLGTDSPSADDPPFVEARGWELAIEPTEEEEPAPETDGPEGIDSVWDVLEELNSALPQVRRWVPFVRLSDGVARVDGTPYAVPSLEWRNGELKGTAREPDLEQTIRVGVDLSSEGHFPVEVDVNPVGAALRAEVARETEVWRLDGSIAWEGETMDLQGEFARGEWLPRRAAIVADPATIPGSLVPVQGYDRWRITLLAEWQEAGFNLDFRGEGVPGPEPTFLSPPVQWEISADGSLDTIRLETLQVDAAWAGLRLRDRLVWMPDGGGLQDRSVIDLAVSLNELELPDFPLKGRINGELAFEPRKGEPSDPVRKDEAAWAPSDLPTITFELGGDGIEGWGTRTEPFQLAGGVSWPWLEFEALEVGLPDGSRFNAMARVDLEQEAIASAGWEYSGNFINRFLPEGVRYDGLHLQGEAEGPWDDPTHSGSITIDRIVSPSLNPLGAELHWEGQGTAIEQGKLIAGAAASVLSAGFNVELRQATEADGGIEAISGSLEELTLTRHDEPLYTLASPARFSLRPSPEPPDGMAFELGKLDWEGDDRKIGLEAQSLWPEEGNVAVQLRRVPIADFADFLPAAELPLTVANFGVEAGWQEGPLEFDLDAEAEWEEPGMGRFVAQAGIEGDGEGIRVQEAGLISGEAPILTAQGQIPLTLRLDQSPVHDLRLDAPLNFEMTSRPDPVFLKRVAEWGGIRLKEPAMRLTLAGPMEAMEGELNLQAGSVLVQAEGLPEELPPITDIRLRSRLTPEAFHLEEFFLAVKGQPVQANGSLPLKAGWENRLVAGELPDWREATGRFWIDQAEVAPFVSYLPTVLVPQGDLTLDLKVAERRFQGELIVNNAATRPLAPLGPIREIEARIAFSDNEATLERFQGRLGGEPVDIQGEVRIQPEGALEYEGRLVGENIPLIRQPGMILRSDLDIEIAQSDENQTVVSGKVGLRNGLLLQDLEMLIPGSLSQPSQRPPFFSIEDPPLANWELDLEIRGDEFMQVRNPVFRGQLSANLTLTETLREPMALGEVRIASGHIRFPFGNLDIQQGFVTLTSEDPFRPQLLVTAQSSVFGYHVTMNVEGYADEPQITFSSTPPLTSEEVLLMLTAGEIPQQEFGFTGQQKAARLAVFLGRDLLNRLGADEASADRFTIRTGENITTEGELTYSAEYRLTDRWSVIGELDRFGELNGGLKWRIFSR